MTEPVDNVQDTGGQLVERNDTANLEIIVKSFTDMVAAGNETQLKAQQENNQARQKLLETALKPGYLVLVFLMAFITYLTWLGEVDRGYELLTYILTFAAGLATGFSLKKSG